MRRGDGPRVLRRREVAGAGEVDEVVELFRAWG